MDFTGPFYETPFAGSRLFAMLGVDDLIRFKMVHFLKCEGDTTAAMRDIMATLIARPLGLKIDIVRTDGGGQFVRPFQSLLKDSKIQHKLTHPSHTPV